jgi:tetratricopeptide (TPR) repeat protein
LKDGGDPQASLRVLETLTKGENASGKAIAQYCSLQLNSETKRDPEKIKSILSILQAGAALQPPVAEVFECLGDWSKELGDAAKAKNAYKKALDLSPFLAGAFETLSEIDKPYAIEVVLMSIEKNLKNYNYYELLDVDAKASAAAIQKAYRNCTKRFHPDRFFQLDDPKMQDLAKLVYKRMVEAYMTLKNSARRTEYDAQLVNRKKFERKVEMGVAQHSDFSKPKEPQTLQGKKFFELGMTAIRQGNLDTARMNFQLGSQIEPSNPVFQDKLLELQKRQG